MRTKNYIHGKAAVRCAVILIVIICLTVGVSAAELCAGGMPFGVRFKTEGVIVAGLGEVETADGGVCPAKDAGLEVRDLLISVKGKRIGTSDELVRLVSESGGKAIEIKYSRGGVEYTTMLTPVRDKSGVYRAGMWVRDSAAGIGTVTFYDPETGEFAGLGHGICDSETGKLIPLSSGRVTDVSIFGIERGIAGTPGELKGCFGIHEIGSVEKNTATGVYGKFTSIPNGGEPIEVAGRRDVCEGEVTIRCTLADGDMRDYKAEISSIDRSGREDKSFIITVTDEELIERTGGIVQGMSGSPVIQNGKLIGAVTHVMINDPTRGYGIFIENMIRGAA